MFWSRPHGATSPDRVCFHKGRGWRRYTISCIRLWSDMDTPKEIRRRDVLASAGAVFTTSLFTGRVKGANDRVAVGYIGLGAMGSGNVGYGMQVPEIQVATLCDVYQPALEKNEAAAK